MKKNIDELVVNELDRLLKKDPMKLANAMLAVFATGLVEARSAVTKVSNELTIQNKRYKIDCKIEIKEVELSERQAD